MNRKALVLGLGVLASASLASADSRLPRQHFLREVQQSSQQVARDAMNLLDAADDRAGFGNGPGRQQALQAIISFESSAHTLYSTVGAHIRADELPGQRPDPTIVEYAMDQLEIDFRNLYPAIQGFPLFRQQVAAELSRLHQTVARLVDLFDPMFEVRAVAADFSRAVSEAAQAAGGEHDRSCVPRPIWPGQGGSRRCGQMRAASQRLEGLLIFAQSAANGLVRGRFDRGTVEQNLNSYDTNARIAENFMNMAQFSQHVVTQQAQARAMLDRLRQELNQVRR